MAALGNLKTGGGNITVSAGGNIAVGTLTAGNGSVGTVSVMAGLSGNGAILFSNAAIPNVTAHTTNLQDGYQPVSTNQSAALAELNATEVIAAADAAARRQTRRRTRPARRQPRNWPWSIP